MSDSIAEKKRCQYMLKILVQHLKDFEGQVLQSHTSVKAMRA